MAGPKSSSAPMGAAPADSHAAANLQDGATRAEHPVSPRSAVQPNASAPAPPVAVATDGAAPTSELASEMTPLQPGGRRPMPAPALSAYEEELLRAYSPTLAGTYERWKEEGDDMPLVLAVMLRQWRTAGCPVDRGSENEGTAGSGGADHNSADPRSHANNPPSRPDCCYDDSCGDCPAATLHAAECAAQAAGDATDNGTVRVTLGEKHIKPASAKAAAKSPLLRESAPKAKSDKGEKGSDKNAQMTLPGVSVPRTPGETAPMSNYLARTSLFAPIRKGRRVMHDKQMLHSPEGIDVLYTGKQLDMADQDVYLTALRLAGGIKAGDRILINRAAFLRMLGYKHNPGARDYKWLEESFYRISTGRVIIKAKHIEANLPLMGALLTDTRSGDYYFTIPRETYALWAKNLYSYIDLEKRHALERNVPLSKWLQSYAQSHAPGTHTISMDLLHLWCGYGGRLRDFRDSLTGALEELTRVGILTSWAIQERGKGRQKKIMISWVRERTHRDDAPPPLVEE